MLELKERIDDPARTGKQIADWGADPARGATPAADEEAQEPKSGIVGAVKEKVHDVTAGAADLIGKATDKAQEWASSVGDCAVSAKDKAQEWASSVGDAAVYTSDKAQQAASATVEMVGDLTKEASALIRRYPFPAVCVGVGAGFLFGQVLHHWTSKKVR